MKTLLPSGRVIEPGFAALSVNLSHFNLLPIVMRGNTQLRLKKEFHVTLISLGGVPRTNYSLEALCAAVRSVEFRIELLDEYFFISKFYDLEHRTRKSAIVRVNVVGAEEFYFSLSTLTGNLVKMTPPPFHITLYTGGDDADEKGIGIRTQEELDTLGQKLTRSAAAPIRSRFL